MFILQFISLVVIYFSTTLSFASGVKIYDTQTQQFITSQELFKAIPEKGQLVLGEEHYQELIQKAEGDIIRGVLQAKKLQNNFSTCWEFLNYPDQKVLNSHFLSFKKGLLSISDLFSKLFVSTKPQVHHPYRHLFNVTREFGGEFIAINAPRSWKRIITKSGLVSLDSNLIPENMELGGQFYKDRFVQAMGGHVSEEKIPYYFEAQSYTDSVMTSVVQTEPNQDLKFVIVGSFHSDFNDGLVAQLTKYNSAPTTTIKIINTKALSKKEIEGLLSPHPEYGFIADYIYMLSKI